MSGTHTIVMGDRGRLVIPADVRTAANSGKDLVAELLAERRAQAAADSA